VSRVAELGHKTREEIYEVLRRCGLEAAALHSRRA
jgi:hypothetical protein